MKKVNYFLASLIGLAFFANLTGCMENTEPQGINELRTAKAALITAQASYVAAETQWMYYEALSAKYLAVQDSIQAETDLIDLKIKEATGEYDITYWQYKLDSLTEKQNEVMFTLQAETATAQEKLLEAQASLEVALLTVTDSTFNKAITEYQGYISTISNNLNSLISTYQGAVVAMNAYVAKNENFAVTVESKITSKQSELEIQQGILADLKALESSSTDEYNTTAEAKQVELNALLVEIETMKTAVDAKWKALDDTEIQAKQASLQVATIDVISKDDVAASMVPAMKSAFGATYTYTPTVGNQTTVTYINSENEMIADYSIYSTVQNAAGVVNTAKGKINTMLNSAYDNKFGTSTNPTDDLTESKIAQMNNNVALVTLDAEQKKAAYTSATSAWVAAYAAFDKAVTAYNAYTATEPYDAVAKDIKAYIDLADPADKTVAAANAMLAKVAPYGKLRDALDSTMVVYGTTPLYTFTVVDDLTGTDEATKKISITDFNGAVTATTAILPTSDTWSKSYGSTTKEQGSVVSLYIKANDDLFGTGLAISAYSPTAYIPSNGAIPADLEETFTNSGAGAYGAYLTKVAEAAIFADVDKWVAIAAKLKATADAYTTQVTGINNAIAELEVAIEDEVDAIQADEYAIMLKDSDYTGSTVGSASSYTSIYSAPANGEKQLLVDLISSLEDAAKSSGVFSYAEYDASTGEYTYVTGDITSVINTLEQTTIPNLEDQLAELEQDLLDFNDLGFDNSSYKQALQDAIDAALFDYENAVDEIARLTVIVNKLIESQIAVE